MGSDNDRLIVEQIPHLRRYAVALLGDRDRADDLVQDCLARAWSRMHLWRPGGDMRPWLFTILHNLHVNALRRRSGAPDSLALDAGFENRHAAEAAQEDGLTVRDLARALDLISDEQRQVVLLVGLEDMSYKEAAAVVGVPVGTVMSRLARGREALRRLIEGNGTPALRRVK